MAPCEFARLAATPAVHFLHAVPRYLPPRALYRPPGSGGSGEGVLPLPFTNHTFKFWDKGEYAISVGFTSALCTFGVALMLLAVLCCCGVATSCCGCGRECCRASSRNPDTKVGRRLPALLSLLHVALLLVLAVAAATPLCWGSAGFARGVDAMLASYGAAASNFSHVDAALTELTALIARAEDDVGALIREDPCHSSFAQEKLHTILAELSDATSFAADLTRRLGPINSTLAHVEGDVQTWGGKGELVRWWAVLAPCACVMLYVMLEVAATERRACCRPVCGYICCVSRSLGRAVGVVTLVALFGSSFVYLVIGVAGADYCSGPDAVLIGGLDHEGVAQRQVIAFFALCPPNNATGYPQVRQFQSYFAEAEGAFEELDQAFEAYDLLCPTTKSSRALESNMRAAEAVFRRDVSPFQSCGAIQPQYCTAVADGVCGTFVSGAAETAASQAGAALLLFGSLLVSFLIGAAGAKEVEEVGTGAEGDFGQRRWGSAREERSFGYAALQGHGSYDDLEFSDVAAEAGAQPLLLQSRE